MIIGSAEVLIVFLFLLEPRFINGFFFFFFFYFQLGLFYDYVRQVIENSREIIFELVKNDKCNIK
jgi:hypothetical protein